MQQAIIYSPSKTAMQSGTAKTGYWILEFKSVLPQVNNPLMGWAGGSETEMQISLKFNTQDEAVAYANSHDISFTVRKSNKRGLRIKSYNENYAFNKREIWTHKYFL